MINFYFKNKLLNYIFIEQNKYNYIFIIYNITLINYYYEDIENTSLISFYPSICNIKLIL